MTKIYKNFCTNVFLYDNYVEKIYLVNFLLTKQVSYAKLTTELGVANSYECVKNKFMNGG